MPFWGGGGVYDVSLLLGEEVDKGDSAPASSDNSTVAVKQLPDHPDSRKATWLPTPPASSSFQLLAQVGN